MDELINLKCVDFKSLLLLKGKTLKYTSDEILVLLMIMTLTEQDVKPINPSVIGQYCPLPVSRIDEVLLKLLNKKTIQRNRGMLSLKPLYLDLLNQSHEEEEEKDIFMMFENVFGRTLNHMEVETIQSFKTSGYDDDMILNALNEAVKSNVLNFRYIEKILVNWSKHGVKRRYVTDDKLQTTKEDIASSIKDFKWWLDE